MHAHGDVGGSRSGAFRDDNITMPINNVLVVADSPDGARPASRLFVDSLQSRRRLL